LEAPLETLKVCLEFAKHVLHIKDAHPELKSKPIAPHPLFKEFIAAALRLNTV
jgi:CTP synthase (UTP-ammonia lyase)